MAKYESVQVQGLDQLAKALRELPQRVARNGLRAAVYAGAKVIRDEAKLQAPVATGDLGADAGQLALMTALVTGVAKSFKLLLPNGNTATFTAYVKKFNSQGAVDQAIRRSAELRISGSITWA